MIRNGLLACQVVNTDWIPRHPNPPADTDSCIYNHEEVCRRAVGLFCFSTPHAYQSYNTDLVGGAVQSLCEAYHAGITCNAGEVRVNLLFSADSSYASVASSLPEAGELTITLKQPGKLFVFAPDWIDDSTVRICVNQAAQAVTRRGSYFDLGPLPDAATVTISFPQPARHTSEFAAGFAEPFEIDWLGDTITALTPLPAPPLQYGPLY